MTTLTSIIEESYTPPVNGLQILHLCPERPSDLGLTIPGDQWWSGQRESIVRIIHAFWAGKKYVLAGIPTGGGKTLIAAAVQMILANQTGIAGGRSLALTHTIQLQGQYLKTLTNAKVITGRSNHLCDLPADDPAKITEAIGDKITAESAPCASGEACSVGLNSRGGCGYYRQWWEAADAPMTIMNYAYAARILQIQQFRERTPDGEIRSIDNPFHRDLLVMDECHLAHDALVEAAGQKLWVSALNEAHVALPPLTTKTPVQEGGPRSQKTVHYENVEFWKVWAKSSRPAIKERIDDLSSDLDGVKQQVSGASSVERPGVIRQLMSLKAKLKSLLAANDCLRLITKIERPDEWIIRRDIGRNNQVVSVTVQPIWGMDVIPQMLFRHFNLVLLMSATPGDPDVARVIMGIPEEEFLYIERPSTFPVQNRLVYYYPVAKLNYRSSDLEWEKIANAIASIAQNPAHIHRKGLVHSGSAVNARKLVGLLNVQFGWKRAFSHGDSAEYTREEALTEFIGSSDPRILVTASFTTGLDLPYIIGWQVIAKVPYGNLGDEITSRRRAFKLADGRSFGQTYYAAASMNTVVQAAGRIVRSPSDTGPTFILDAAYAVLHATAFKPQFFSDAFRKIDKGGK